MPKNETLFTDFTEVNSLPGVEITEITQWFNMLITSLYIKVGNCVKKKATFFTKNKYLFFTHHECIVKNVCWLSIVILYAQMKFYHILRNLFMEIMPYEIHTSSRQENFIRI